MTDFMRIAAVDKILWKESATLLFTGAALAVTGSILTCGAIVGAGGAIAAAGVAFRLTALNVNYRALKRLGVKNPLTSTRYLESIVPRLPFLLTPSPA